MIRRDRELRFGASLSRNDCPNCGPNSLHKFGKCIHCGRDFVAHVTRPKGWHRIVYGTGLGVMPRKGRRKKG